MQNDSSPLDISKAVKFDDITDVLESKTQIENGSLTEKKTI